MRGQARRHARRKVLLAVLAALVIFAAIAGIALATSRWRLRAETSDESGAGKHADHVAVSSPASATAPEGAASATTSGPAAPASAATHTARAATVTVSAVGDMIFDRRVKSLIAAQGGGAPLSNVAARLRRADVTVGNLESNLSNSGTPAAGKDVTFRGDPDGIAGLEASGFDFLSLANNHVLDYGTPSLKDTLAALDEAGIAHAGAGMDRAAAWKPAVVKRRGATIAFLSFSQILPAGFVATGSRAGLAPGRGNPDAVASAIRDAKARYDYVIVSFHWGVEYEDYANGEQVRDARRAIDAGADMVLSHHPHVIQGVELYKNRLIAYSLGDFVFDHYSRKTGESFILDAKLGPDGVSDVVAVPTYLNGSGAPSVVTGSEAATILRRLGQISLQHGTKVRIDGSIARISR
jgi:hypothetical protein